MFRCQTIVIFAKYSFIPELRQSRILKPCFSYIQDEQIKYITSMAQRISSMCYKCKLNLLCDKPHDQLRKEQHNVSCQARTRNNVSEHNDLE